MPNAQAGLSLLVWDACDPSHGLESDRWASTARGWARDPNHPDRERCHNGNLPIGNYLDYGQCGEHYRARPEGAVHAVYTPWWTDPDTGYTQHVTRASAWLPTAEDAQEWIRLQHFAKHGPCADG